MNNEAMLENYLYKNIPLSQAMGVKILQADLEKIILEAPLLNNINHKKTVFGGSLHSMATLACWSLLYMNTRQIVPIPHLVIVSSETHYLAPVEGDFQVECLKPELQFWNRFTQMLHKKGKGRIELKASIYFHHKLALRYTAIFAALSTIKAD